MKRLFMTVVLALTVAGLMSCSGGGGGASSGGGTSSVSIAVGSTSQAAFHNSGKEGFFAKVTNFFKFLMPGDAVAAASAIPEGVDKVIFTIQGPGMDTITREVTINGQSEIVETFDVPNGSGRIFSVSAENSCGGVIYSGTSTADINGTLAITITLEDAGFELAEVDNSWDGVTAAENSDNTYDGSFSYTLPWCFTFYGASYEQIEIDSNGNVWFDYDSYDDSFPLPAANGHGRVIAAWNEYLSSYDNGEYKVQHKTDPERVVIEWDTQTYDDYSSGCEGPCLNNFEIILYQDGRIRIDYNEFNYQSSPTDNGSGISKGDGSNYLSITDTYGDAFTLGGRSFMFTPD